MQELTEAERAELGALSARHEQLQGQTEAHGEDDGAVKADEARLDELENYMEAIREPGRIYAPDEKSLAGCIVYLDHGGAVTVAPGYVKPEDKPALERLRRSRHEGGEAGDGDEALPRPRRSRLRVIRTDLNQEI